MAFCERCKKAQATFHILNIDPSDHSKEERHLCDACADEEGVTPSSKPTLAAETLQALLASKQSSESVNPICDECGTSYFEFRNQGMLGCPNDYEAFRTLLHPLIERAQDGAEKHVGKRPRAAGATNRTAELRRLKRALESALGEENYELAARVRDELRELEGR